jgi:predicted ABC-type exoprotein transport system permease subunit
VSLMNENLSTIAGIIGSLVVVFVMLPMLVGGTGSSLFWLLFWLLLLALIASIYYAITNRHRQH